MARIRSIKPEFPHSETMGRVSREARLTFILLWTISDDNGRLRGNSRMLASLLFPYDDDASQKIEAWLNELDKEKAIIRYSIDGDCYIEICNFLKHQRIDHPSPSKIPAFREDSRGFARTTGTLAPDHGLDHGLDHGREGSVPPIPADPRFKEFIRIFSDYWRANKIGNPPIMRKDAAQLKNLLRRQPNLTPEGFARNLEICDNDSFHGKNFGLFYVCSKYEIIMNMKTPQTKKAEHVYA